MLVCFIRYYLFSMNFHSIISKHKQVISLQLAFILRNSTCWYGCSMYLITPSCIITQYRDTCVNIINGAGIRFSIIKSFKSSDIIQIARNKICELINWCVFSVLEFALSIRKILIQQNFTTCMRRPRLYGFILRHSEFLSNARLAASTALFTSAWKDIYFFELNGLLFILLFSLSFSNTND